MSAAAAQPLRAIAYVRVSTDDQARNGASLEAQKRAVSEAAAQRGWSIEVVSEAQSAKRSRRRPGFERCLEQLDSGDYQALIVARLDRAFRSLAHFAETLDRSDKRGWEFVVLDPPVDTQTPFGRAMAGMAAVWAELERAIGSKRTREGMAQKALDGSWKNGRPPGGQRQLSDEALRYVRRQWGRKSQAQIARDLNELGIRAPRGGLWSQQAVASVIARYLKVAESAPAQPSPDASPEPGHSDG